MQSELGAPALLKTVWWDLHLVSLLTHLFLFVFLYGYSLQCFDAVGWATGRASSL